ncbi:unnamed protein product, partial [Brassica oleracea]
RIGFKGSRKIATNIACSSYLPETLTTRFNHALTNLDRLYTRCRIASWDPGIDKSCLLCGHEQVWKLVIHRLGYRPFLFHTWTAFISWLDDLNDNTCSITLRRLVAQAVIYSIWSERNNRLPNATSSVPQRIFKDIDRLVLNIILARKKRKKFRKLMQAWLRFS